MSSVTEVLSISGEYFPAFSSSLWRYYLLRLPQNTSLFDADIFLLNAAKTFSLCPTVLKSVGDRLTIYINILNCVLSVKRWNIVFYRFARVYSCFTMLSKCPQTVAVNSTKYDFFSYVTFCLIKLFLKNFLK